MAGRTLALSRKRGFSLVEMLIVIVLMTIVMVIASTLMSSVVQMHQASTDLTGGARRSQEVFDLLKTPIQNAGLGVRDTDFDYYFGTLKPGVNNDAFIRDWPSALFVRPNPLNTTGDSRGDVLRVAYSVPTRAKYVGDAVDSFSETKPEGISATVQMSFVAQGDDIPLLDADSPLGLGRWTNTSPTSSRWFITFPGRGMHPLAVRGPGTLSMGPNYSTCEFTVEGVAAKPASGDDTLSSALPGGVIPPYAELCLFRASIAFVDDESTFWLIDVEGSDYPNSWTIPTDLESRSAFRIEGIKSVRFFPAPDRRSVTVWLLAESDRGDPQRGGLGAVAAIKDRTFNVPGPTGYTTEKIWEDVEFEPGIYYEDFFMTWRTRDLPSQ